MVTVLHSYLAGSKIKENVEAIEVQKNKTKHITGNFSNMNSWLKSFGVTAHFRRTLILLHSLP